MQFEKILSFRKLPSRAFGARLMFATIIMTSSAYWSLANSQKLMQSRYWVSPQEFGSQISFFDLKYWKTTKPEYR
jgi:hypothetical protein